VTPAALLALAALAYAAYHARRPLGWEQPIVDAVRNLPFPTREFWIAMFEPVPFALTTTALACAAAAKSRLRLAVSGYLSCLVAVVLGELVLKPLVHRIHVEPMGRSHHLVRLHGYMFPSAHTTAAAAFATFGILLVGRRSRWVPLLLALPVVVAVATMSKQLHYPADVLAGMLLGPLVVVHGVAFARRLERKPATPELPTTLDDEPLVGAPAA